MEAECRSRPQFKRDLRELWGVIMVARVAGSGAAVAPTLPPEAASEFPSGTLTLPAKFGDYELREELGRGGMGVVYRAQQLSLLGASELAGDQRREPFFQMLLPRGDAQLDF